MPNPDFTKDARERVANAIDGVADSLETGNAAKIALCITKHIRQAEQAAREKALEDALSVVTESCGCAADIRALKDQK